MKGLIVGLLSVLGSGADHLWLAKYASEKLSNNGFEREMGTKVIDCVYEANLTSEESLENAISCVTAEESHLEKEKKRWLSYKIKAQKQIDEHCSNEILDALRKSSKNQPGCLTEPEGAVVNQPEYQKCTDAITNLDYNEGNIQLAREELSIYKKIKDKLDTRLYFLSKDNAGR